MDPITVRVVGLAIWLAHVACYLSGRGRLSRPFWVYFWLWMAGLPAAAGYYISIFSAAPIDENARPYTREQDFWLNNAAWCLAEWVVFLVVEPLLLYAGDLVFRRLDRTAHPHRPE
ncbi:hypothetical protein AB1484_01690 [Parafrankia sp. FMc6]|uniref:hypothetical protein n=1 Tax=Parafrankia soli TaxID=2599596 RepID=UPI0034D4636C